MGLAQTFDGADVARMTVVEEIFDLFARFGSERYGEDLSLAAHMLQSAAHAQALGASGSLVVAALLHDIGYLVLAREGLGDPGADTRHESVGAAWLSRGFDAEVTRPIALHVRAKQYLCAVEPGYAQRLSAESRRTLALQGGAMSAAEAAAFAADPACAAAVTLRRCDDLGKDANLRTPSLEDWGDLLARRLRPA